VWGVYLFCALESAFLVVEVCEDDVQHLGVVEKKMKGMAMMAIDSNREKAGIRMIKRLCR
jgi:hypothetical protein